MSLPMRANDRRVFLFVGVALMRQSMQEVGIPRIGVRPPPRTVWPELADEHRPILVLPVRSISIGCDELGTLMESGAHSCFRSV